MQHCRTKKTTSLTELHEPKKVLEQAAGEPVAILDRNQIVGYLVPASAVEKFSFETADSDEVMVACKKRQPALNQILDHLKNKSLG